MASYQHRIMPWILGISLLTVSVLTPMLGAAHSKQPHTVVGFTQATRSEFVVFQINTATQKGNALVKFKSEAAPRTVKINCTKVYSGFYEHTIIARGKSTAGKVYLEIRDYNFDSPGPSTDAVYIGTQPGPYDCGRGTLETGYTAVVLTAKQ